jgi:hypothetical protein
MPGYLRGVVVDETRGGLRRQPFAHVAFVQLGLACQALGRSRFAILHRLVESQAVAQQDERPRHRRTKVTDKSAHQCIEFIRIGCPAHFALLWDKSPFAARSAHYGLRILLGMLAILPQMGPSQNSWEGNV